METSYALVAEWASHCQKDGPQLPLLRMNAPRSSPLILGSETPALKLFLIENSRTPVHSLALWMDSGVLYAMNFTREPTPFFGLDLLQENSLESRGNKEMSEPHNILTHFIQGAMGIQGKQVHVLEPGASVWLRVGDAISLSGRYLFPLRVVPLGETTETCSLVFGNGERLEIGPQHCTTVPQRLFTEWISRSVGAMAQHLFHQTIQEDSTQLTQPEKTQLVTSTACANIEALGGTVERVNLSTGTQRDVLTQLLTPFPLSFGLTQQELSWKDTVPSVSPPPMSLPFEPLSETHISTEKDRLPEINMNY